MSQQINLYEERLRPSSELCTGRNVGFALALVLAVVCLGAMIYYNTLLFLIFAAMMLLAYAWFLLTHPDERMQILCFSLKSG